MSVWTGGSAYPVPEQRDVYGTGIREGSDGMTLRDYFATAAMNALILRSGSGREMERVGIAAYEIADLMLTAREVGS